MTSSLVVIPLKQELKVDFKKLAQKYHPKWGGISAKSGVPLGCLFCRLVDGAGCLFYCLGWYLGILRKVIVFLLRYFLTREFAKKGQIPPQTVKSHPKQFVCLGGA